MLKTCSGCGNVGNLHPSTNKIAFCTYHVEMIQTAHSCEDWTTENNRLQTDKIKIELKNKRPIIKQLEITF